MQTLNLIDTNAYFTERRLVNARREIDILRELCSRADADKHIAKVVEVFDQTEFTIPHVPTYCVVMEL